MATGATGSLHCALMCGPLACSAVKGGGPRWRIALAWHLGRVGAYLLVGLLLGALGSGIARSMSNDLMPYLPWVLVAGLLASTFGVGRHLPALPGTRWLGGLLAKAGRKLPPALASALFGTLTPLLPCGFLYGLFLSASATGSGVGGALVLGAFALGTMPALAAVQLGLQRPVRNTKQWRWLRWAIPLCAVAVLVFRAVTAPPTGPPICH